MKLSNRLEVVFDYLAPISINMKEFIIYMSRNAIENHFQYCLYSALQEDVIIIIIGSNIKGKYKVYIHKVKKLRLHVDKN